jgi:hypothetical protein
MPSRSIRPTPAPTDRPRLHAPDHGTARALAGARFGPFGVAPIARGAAHAKLVAVSSGDDDGRSRSHGPRPVAAALVALALVAAACSSAGSGSTSDSDPSSGPKAALRITTLSGPAEYVTGGDAVVGVDSPAGRTLDGVTVTLDGADVTGRFSPDTSPHRASNASPRLVGRLTDLPPGTSELVATSGDDRATVTLTDHDIAGPLFSGPHQSPFVCTTEAAGLGAPGPECGASSTVAWRYVTTAGSMVDLADPNAVPADAATTTTTEGRQVPFVVRVETSVLNRAIVETAILDPHPGAGVGSSDIGTGSSDIAWDPSGWNGRLVLRFGGGCGTTYSQGDVSPTALQLDLLGSGYGVVASSLTSFDTACNATVSAETALVAKEHFAETYGVPRHTIGSGSSGGSIQQLQIVQNYPGILDAIAPTAAFPDAVSIAAGVSDCGLMERWFGRDGGPAGIIPTGQPSGAALTSDQQIAITGFASPATCSFWTSTFVDTLDASEGCSPEIVSQVYDLAVRPRGVRCTWQDGNVNMLGTDPSTGYAARPLDNVGVQYGLDALESGVISVDEFLDLNEHIGGYDLDGTWQPERERSADEVPGRAYAAGMVTAGTATEAKGALGAEGSGGLVDVPIIVLNPYTDPLGDIHDRQRAFAIRDRLRRPDGTDDPALSIWTIPAGTDIIAIARLLSGGAEDAGQPIVRILDQWLTAAEESSDGGTWAERLAAAKPADAADRCVLPSGEIVTGPDVYADGTPCSDAYPVHADPRRAAGSPLVNDVLACDLTPVDPSSYGVGLSDDQAQRLRRIFPEGVCDWSHAGRGQRPPAGTWQVFDQP